MPKVTMWRASDNELFETESEYNLYEQMLREEKSVDEHLARTEFANEAQRSKARKHILNYLKDMALQPQDKRDEAA